MENKELNCACTSCEDCETCSIEQDSKDSEEDAEDIQQTGPVALRDYTGEIDAYMSYLLNGAFGKLYKKDPKPDSAVYSTKGSSMREHMWVIFSTVVGLHLREYTIPQYGDFPGDQLTGWTADQCFKQIGKYVARADSNARGEDEKLTDLLKIAHYASVAWLSARGYEDLFKVVMPEDLTHEEMEERAKAASETSEVITDA